MKSNINVAAKNRAVQTVLNKAVGLDPATIASIREGIADGEAGREQPFEEYVAEMKAKRQAWKKTNE